MKDFKKNALLVKYPMLGSSQDPDKVKLRVKAVGIALIPLAIWILRMIGIDSIQETELVGLIDLLSKAAMLVTGLWAVAWEIWGWVRVVLNKNN